VAEAVQQLGLSYVVLTSVTRDDLPDGGASHFAATIRAVHAASGARVEVLTPDFRGDRAALATVLAAQPAVFNHNLETVRRLTPLVRPQADYDRSLGVLRAAREIAPGRVRKSGIMVGLGESDAELAEAMRDLHAAGCQMLTIGQYLQPSRRHLPVARYVPPEKFADYARLAREIGLAKVIAGPFVRSSYHAAEAARSFPAAG
jgi:lipoic acid synthetase